MISRLVPLVLCVALFAATAHSRAADYETAWVSFPALKPFEGKPVELDALVYRPSGPGPFPALIPLHGCGGMFTSQGYPTASYRNWADILVSRGYVALLVDSFNPRGHWSICDQRERTILESRERAEDAYAALRWLEAQPFVARGRLGLLGWSNGATGTLYAMRESRPARGFRAAVAFYPGCRAISRSRPPYRPYAPLIVLSGEADDWTPAAPCVALAESAKREGGPMEIVTYPGAHHSFDRINLPLRYRPTVRNPNNPGRLGATVGENPAARDDAIRRTLEFFAMHLASEPPANAGERR
ncbi:MAG: dienelactone hydrolase family protein [Burkholderiales bacterium]|nr:dienelactone hydrolase family protein [Burkholderiales bacterium]